MFPLAALRPNFHQASGLGSRAPPSNKIQHLCCCAAAAHLPSEQPPGKATHNQSRAYSPTRDHHNPRHRQAAENLLLSENLKAEADLWNHGSRGAGNPAGGGVHLRRECVLHQPEGGDNLLCTIFCLHRFRVCASQQEVRRFEVVGVHIDASRSLWWFVFCHFTLVVFDRIRLLL